MGSLFNEKKVEIRGREFVIRELAVGTQRRLTTATDADGPVELLAGSMSSWTVTWADLKESPFFRLIEAGEKVTADGEIPPINPSTVRCLPTKLFKELNNAIAEVNGWREKLDDAEKKSVAT